MRQMASIGLPVPPGFTLTTEAGKGGWLQLASEVGALCARVEGLHALLPEWLCLDCKLIEKGRSDGVQRSGGEGQGAHRVSIEKTRDTEQRSRSVSCTTQGAGVEGISSG